MACGCGERARRDSNPNLLTRRSVQHIRPVRLHPYPQVKVHQLSRMAAEVRCCPASP